MTDDKFIIEIFIGGGSGSYQYRVAHKRDTNNDMYTSNWHSNITNVADDAFQLMAKNGRERTWHLLLRDEEMLDLVLHPIPEAMRDQEVLGSDTPVQMYHILLAHLRFITTAD